MEFAIRTTIESSRPPSPARRIVSSQGMVISSRFDQLGKAVPWCTWTMPSSGASRSCGPPSSWPFSRATADRRAWPRCASAAVRASPWASSGCDHRRYQTHGSDTVCEVDQWVRLVGAGFLLSAKTNGNSTWLTLDPLTALQSPPDGPRSRSAGYCLSVRFEECLDFPTAAQDIHHFDRAGCRPIAQISYEDQIFPRRYAAQIG